MLLLTKRIEMLGYGYGYRIILLECDAFISIEKALLVTSANPTRRRRNSEIARDDCVS